MIRQQRLSRCMASCVKVFAANMSLVLIVLASYSVSSAQDFTCTDCHYDSRLKLQGQHDRASLTCEACHSDSTAHLADPSQSPGFVFKGADDRGDESCLTCHNKGEQTHWSASAHRSGDVACTDCHEVHTNHDPMSKKSTAQQACLACHTTIKSTLHQRSRHPIKELKTACTDCHASHGSVSSSGELTTSSSRQLCLECHKEKTGPYLFEHEPVTEDCGLCHKPHGSQHPSLLTSRSPFLCQQCHMASDHPGQIPRGVNSQNLASHGCLNCHGAVHGSNHPSGARLMK